MEVLTDKSIIITLGVPAFFVLIIIEVISTNFIQSYINNKNIIYIISGCSGYLIVGILFYYYLTNSG